MKSLLECETYFNHSVQGLGKGSSVQFRGFKVGQVTSVSLAASADDSTPAKQLVKVTFTINPELLTGSKLANASEAKSFLIREIRSGLRIIFSFQGISGISLLNLDYAEENQKEASAPNAPGTPVPAKKPVPDAPAAAVTEARTEGATEGETAADPGTGETFFSPKPVPLFPDRKTPEDSPTLVIPSAPGTIMEFGESLTQILRSFREIDFATLNRELTSLLENLNQISANLNRETGGFSEALLTAIDEIKSAASEIQTLATTVNLAVNDLTLNASLKELEAAIAETRTTIRNVNNLLKLPQSSLPTTLENLRVMSENLRELSELARQYPSQLILGEPPPREVPRPRRQ